MMLPLLLLLAGGLVAAAAFSGADETEPEKSGDLSLVAAAVREKKLAAIRALPTRKERLAALLKFFPDAHPMNADKYSAHVVTPAEYGLGSDNFARDEFGRAFKGVPWKPGSFAVQVFEQVLPYLPIPPGSKAAIAAAIALGQGKALDDAAMQALKAELPPAAAIGVDLALGIASGKPVDDAAVDAFFSAYPEAKIGYEKAKAVLNYG